MGKIHSSLVILSSLMILWLTVSLSPATAQITHRPVDQAVYVKREASYKTLLTDMRTVRNQPADTAKPPTVSLRLATLYTKNNIYPTKGSVTLIYKLNPDLDADKPIPAGYKLRTPHFTPASADLLEQSRQEYVRLKVPNPSENEIFLGQSKTYDTQLATLQKTITFSPGFTDTTEKFRSIILPGINAKAPIICQAQMQYFNNELRHINQLMDDIIQGRRNDISMIFSINQMIGDFMEITGWPQKKKVQRVTGKFAVRFADVYTPWDNPPNADIYVFRPTTAGEQDTLPSMQAYDVYYDSNGFIYSLTAGCDTLSFFANHPQSPASTLPLTLGKGNYCFVLRDRNTGKIYLQPGVNLAVNKDYDENNRVIIPFYLED